MYMHKFSQAELLNELFADKIKGLGVLAGKAAKQTLKGAVKMVTPTGADILRNVRTAVQKGVEVFTKEQANVVARKYLQDKYESTGSMFNIKELGQSKGNIQGRLVPLTQEEKKEEEAPQVSSNPAQTTNTSTSAPQPRVAATPPQATTTNTTVTEQATPAAATPTQQGNKPQQPNTQQQQDKIQAQTQEKDWPFRFVFFEADVLTKLNPDRQRRDTIQMQTTPDEFRKMKFGVKLIRATKDGATEWTVLNLTNPDGSRFVGINEPVKDNMTVKDKPVSFKKRPETKKQNPYLADRPSAKTGSNFTATDTSTYDLTSQPSGTKVKWQTSKGNIREGEIIENDPKKNIDTTTHVSVKEPNGKVHIVRKDKVIKESVAHINLIESTKLENIFKFR